MSKGLIEAIGSVSDIELKTLMQNAGRALHVAEKNENPYMELLCWSFYNAFETEYAHRNWRKRLVSGWLRSGFTKNMGPEDTVKEQEPELVGRCAHFISDLELTQFARTQNGFKFRGIEERQDSLTGVYNETLAIIRMESNAREAENCKRLLLHNIRLIPLQKRSREDGGPYSAPE